MPPQEDEGIDELERIPRAIVKAPKPVRDRADRRAVPARRRADLSSRRSRFSASLLALSAALGVPSFVFVQWVAPFVSEFPEKVSAFYWARTVDRAPWR